jgi:hypothetical protein
MLWLHEFFSPWFDRGGGAPDVAVRVSVDPRRYDDLHARGPGHASVDAFMMDTRVIRYPVWSGPHDRLTFLDEPCAIAFQVGIDGVDIVCRERGAASRLRVMRVVREFAMGAAQSVGGRFLHAAAVSSAGRAMIITGPRNAGKTTLLSYLLTHLELSFLSNDRLLVSLEGDRVTLRGMPTIVSIRDGTLALFPDLDRAARADLFNSRLTVEESREDQVEVRPRGRQGKKGASPAQYCTLMGCEPVRDARAACILFPRLTGRPGGLSVRPLDRAMTLRCLREGLFGNIAPERLSEAFTLASPAFRSPGARNDADPLECLGREAPGYICELGTDSCKSPEAARQLVQLLRPGGVDCDNTGLSRVSG